MDGILYAKGDDNGWTGLPSNALEIENKVVKFM